VAEHPAETMHRAAMLLREEPGTVSPPGLAEALELLLEKEAVRADKRVSLALLGWWCHECGAIAGNGCDCWDGALATARAVLGEADGNG
jgi:hypothetical protein